MHKFVRNLLTEWRKLKLPFENETFIVAVSGGADSVSLLLALSELRELEKLRLNFVVAHFDHELRGAESERDAEFVADLAKKLNFEFVLGKVQSPKPKIQNQKGNLEQAARLARYEFLLEIAENHQAFGVLTAHTLNDQAETFLLNLIRGSGAGGLSAMSAVRKLNENSEKLLVRPLLDWAKRDRTENFAREKNVGFRLDAMNKDERFARVRVRKKLLPLMAEFNPKIIETLARTARLLGENEKASELPPVVIKERMAAENRSSVESHFLKNLKILSKSDLYGLLREWLRRERGDLRRIELKHLEAVESLIFSRKSGRKVELPGGAAIIKKDGRLFFAETKVEKSRFDN